LGERVRGGGVPSFASVIIQVLLIDLVFSIDSVVTAVGMSKHLTVMILAIIVAVGVMMISAAKVSAFIEKRPTMKMLALAFLIMIGVMLVAEGLGEHIPRGYIYFGMAFALGVEMLNSAAAKRHRRSAPAGADL
jgi:predicted tellurium resistance membrane protein TerC